MKKNSTHLAFLVAILVTGFVMTTSIVRGESQNSHDLPPYVDHSVNILNGDELSVGDIVAQGVPQENETCKFDLVVIRISVPDHNTNRWQGIAIDAECRVIVNAEWEGLLEEGPKDVVDPLLDMLPFVSPLVPENSGTDFASSTGIPALTITSCKTSEQRVFMYGYGGTWDKLTKKTGKITFCYNGSTATLSSHSGGCQGSAPGSWSWVIDRCALGFVTWGPGTIVYRRGEGDYHCDPPNNFPCNLSSPNGYYHTLIDIEEGYYNGYSYCHYGFSGNIVLGVNTEILTGCT